MNLRVPAGTGVLDSIRARAPGSPIVRRDSHALQVDAANKLFAWHVHRRVK